MHYRSIEIKGARQNNLKNLDIDIPINRITVFTGVSGSGKSSLALDTLYAEGQRRYVETFSPFSRQFMDRMDRPQVERIDNIPPAIAIDRKDPVRTSRSTVGTMTEITDYVKLLFAHIGRLHCQNCGKFVHPETTAHVWKYLEKLDTGSEIIISFPFSDKNHDYEATRKQLQRSGFDRYVSKGRIKSLGNCHPPRKNKKDLNIVADRVLIHPAERKRILDSLELAFRMGHGRLDVWIAPDQHIPFSNLLECPNCNIQYQMPRPNLFSFNSPLGACDTCRGFGRIIEIDTDLIIPDPSLTIQDGAIKPWGSQQDHRTEYDQLMVFCHANNIPTNTSFQNLDLAQQKAIIDGTVDYYGIRGFFRWLETKTYKMHVRVFLSRYRSYNICPDCKGTRFKEEALLYRLGDMNIAQIYSLNVNRAFDFFQSQSVRAGDEASRIVLDEISNRLRYLQDVGLEFLTLDRQSRTLSGGEVQRVALASALGSSLVNTLYILDEPSIGLHPSDTHRLIGILKRLRDLQNTIVVVEHDPEIIVHSDFMLDIGPRAGENGGQLMYFGPTKNAEGSLTGQYLRGDRSIPVPKKRRNIAKGPHLSILGASENNLKNIDVHIPLGGLVCLVGVSGSGKSTLAEEILYKALKWAQKTPQGRPGRHRGIKGQEHIVDAILVDQHPIGRTPRANPSTYTKVLTTIRQLLSGTSAAQKKGFGPGLFSFNVAGGRCESCRGDGFEKVEMQFLSDIFITCPDCKGSRFKKEILQITYRDHNIQDILSLTVEQALNFFSDQAKITSALKPLTAVGLGYLRLGQPINTLSSGEAQRLKLSKFLRFADHKHRLYIFDEPSTGLHFEDIGKLIDALQDLIDNGNSVLVIEHNMDIIKTADWIIELGPEGGESGGSVIAAGTPEKISVQRSSPTGRYLKKYLKKNSRAAMVKPLTAGICETSSGFNNCIKVKGAREHNLKNISLSIPRNQLVVLTGVSGSGKSTLAFDILFAEGQRRYLESLAPYVRQYVKLLERPEVDLVSGLPPTVAIEQRISSAGRRSTVATLTEIYHYLRLLFSKVGEQFCPGCSRKLTARKRKEIIEQILMRYNDKKAYVLAPKVTGRKGLHRDVLAKARKNGYRKARIDGKVLPIKADMTLSRYHDHTIELVVGHLPTKALEETVISALNEGAGSLIVIDAQGNEEIFSLQGICPVCGVGLEALDPRLFSFNSTLGACATCSGLGQIETSNNIESNGDRICPCCKGSRLKKAALAVKVNGYSIWDLMQYPAASLQHILKEMVFFRHEAPIAEPVVTEIHSRLSLLNQLGLSYLSLGRSGDTLSGGEAQRVRLAAQLGSNLTGACYILDEPTIGLHPRDNRILLTALKTLKDRGNSVLVVEHDEETIRSADTIIDLGPGAGQKGGTVVASGKLSDLKNTASITGAFIDGHERRITSRLRPYKNHPGIKVYGAVEHNLKNINIEFPLETLICVTGVSGSGKSTLLKEILYKGIRNNLLKKKFPSGRYKALVGWEAVDRVLEVDHNPIGRTPRSVPASYVGFLDDIRKLFAATPDARIRGYRPGRFSFNLAEGRCGACKGHGSLKVAMNFLPDVYVECEICQEKRFNTETLAVRYKGKTMADVLDLTFESAMDFFAAVPSVRRCVRIVREIGLGYLRLGQPSPTLSGGEAQRIKLARELVKPSKGRTFYVLDEPTTGLHISDVQHLLRVLQALIDKGNTVAIIEHNMEVIKEADFIIDLGPEGGNDGGRVVWKGSPVELLTRAKGSHTSRYFSKYIRQN